MPEAAVDRPEAAVNRPEAAVDRPEKADDLSKPKQIIAIILITTECVCAGLILWTTMGSLFQRTPEESADFDIAEWETGSFIAMTILAGVHGVTSTLFTTCMPEIPNNYKPRAYTQLDLLKHLGITLGVSIQVVLIAL